jgi:two-component system sensor histidine kinase QseC
VTRPLSLRLRITVLLVAAIVLTLGTATWLIDSRIDNELSQRADANLLERAQALSDIFRVERTRFDAEQQPDFLANAGRVYFTIDCDGQHVASPAQAAALSWPAASDGQPRFADLSNRRGDELRAVVLMFRPATAWDGRSLSGAAGAEAAGQAAPPARCNLGLAVDTDEVQRFQGSMDAIFLGSILLAILVVVFLVPLLVSRGLKPLAQLAEAMQGIGPQTPERRLANENTHELTPLTARFNEVLARMEQGLVRERQFASGVAHELRTPLAELRTLVEVELRYPSGRDLRTLIADIGNIGVELEHMVGALLLLTRIEAGIEQVQTQPVDVSALTLKLLDRYRASIEERRLQMDVQIASEIVWQADLALLDVLLGNLLGNAVVYAPDGSGVVLHCHAGGWSVRNAAPELTDDDVTLMGQRFWRKGEDAGVHTGVGLALAAAAARAQQLQLALVLTAGELRASVAPQGAMPEVPRAAQR